MLPFQTLLWSSVTRSCFGTDGLLVKILSAEPAMPDSLGTREVIGNPRQTCPIFTGRWRKPKATPKVQRTPPPPPPKRCKSDPDASRPSEPAPASQVAQVEETSPAPVQAPQVLVPEPQAAQPDTTQPMAGAGGDASSPAAKVPTEEVPLPSAQVEEASPTKAEPPSFLPFEFPDSSAPSLPHSEASPAQAKSATGEAEAPAHTCARSPLSSSTDDSDTLEPVASPQDEESSPDLKRELPEISSAQDPDNLSALYKEFLATPKVLSGEVKHHKGTANSPWTCYLPSSLTH